MTKSVIAPETIAERYKVLGRISSGGMGTVFRARDGVLGRVVAIKILPSELANHASFVERFRAEAQAAARLSHPNVVHVYDWGEWDDTYYMVMEFVRGRNLRELLAVHGRLEPDQAVNVVTQCLDGLQAAHSQGLVHRDVKPENLLVALDGIVKIADFGIARLAEAAGTTGGLFGTVAYAAPEQIRNQPPDARTDLYAIGCVLYEALTGLPPFEGDAAGVLQMHLTSAAPSPSAAEPGLPRELDEVVIRATDPEPTLRYQSAAEMKAALGSIAPHLAPAPPLAELTAELTSEVSVESEHTLVSQPAKRRKWRRLVPIVLAVLAIGIAAFFLWPVRVPAVLGDSEKDAVAALSSAGLEVEIARRNSDEPVGTVIAVSPLPGRWTRRGEVVALTISSGPAVVELQSLTGLTLDQAKTILARVRLPLGSVDEEFSREPAGTVLEQSPEPGLVRSGTPVNLVVSKGPEVLEVPDVRTMTYEDAIKTLSDAGFKSAREDVFNDAPAGTVFEQSPEPKSKAYRDSTVLLRVSKGPAPFPMPDVRGKTCAEAKSQLESMGLVVIVRAPSGSKCSTNKVTEQDPFPGATVRKGDEANLYVTA